VKQFTCLILLVLVGISFGAWQTEVVDDAWYSGQYTSIALDSNGYPHIAYQHYDYVDGRKAMYARWDGSAWQIESVLGPSPSIGAYTSLALDSSDKPHIVCYDDTNCSLMYARWNGSSWQIETIEDSTGAGHHSSITIDSSDYRLPSHFLYGWREL